VARLEELRVKTECSVIAARVVVSGLLLEQLIVLQPREADRRNAGDDHLIEVDRIAVPAELVKEVLVFIAALERRFVGAGIDDTGRAADAEQNRVGSALQIDAADVERIPRNIREEVIAVLSAESRPRTRVDVLSVFSVAKKPPAAPEKLPWRPPTSVLGV
jgi:hypothetical protein